MIFVKTVEGSFNGKREGLMEKLNMQLAGSVEREGLGRGVN